MPTARIHLFPEQSLRLISKPVTSFDQSLKVILKRMVQAMEAQPSGIGIAAPQIGILQQIAIVDVSDRVRAAKRLYLVNPRLLEAKDEILSREGCMSLPEYTAYLKRYNQVRVAWQDENGEHQEKAAIGIEAICIQHEIDHLQGMLFIDRVTALKTDMIPRAKTLKKTSN